MSRAVAGILITVGAACTAGAADWEHTRAEREGVVARHVAAAPDGYRWFESAAVGSPAGTPFILLRLFPELAPDLWGPSEDRFARFGFFDTPETAGAAGRAARPLPLGLGWVLDPVAGDAPPPRYHSATLTCAACHVGRVRVGTRAEPLVLIGGPNTEVDVRRFRHAQHETVDHLLGPADLAATANRVKDLIASKEPGYFFRGWYGIDQAAEERERAFVSQNIEQMLAAYAAAVRADRQVLGKQLATSYSLPHAPPLTGGTPGQSDGSGDLLPRLVFARDVLGKPEAERAAALAGFLASGHPEVPSFLATATDNPSVWNQQDRSFGQLDGSVKVPMIRNIAAEVAVVGNSAGVNFRNADITARFTARLPAPPYPFRVDGSRADRGRAVFERNCATCHQAGNTKLYPAALIGTDPNRARVQTPEGRALFLEAFLAAIPEGYEATAPDGQTYVPRRLGADAVLNDRTHINGQGYVAGPLDGVWARAPYLHNGAVPSLRHLLAPDNPDSRRPVAFLRGSVEYDSYNVGFAWRPEEADRLRREAPTAAVYDTRWDGCSRGGHERDLEIDGRHHRLNFSGPDRRQELDDLIEYLKTL
jgi:mono/diheme cytochrome c family protein